MTWQHIAICMAVFGIIFYVGIQWSFKVVAEEDARQEKASIAAQEDLPSRRYRP